MAPNGYYNCGLARGGPGVVGALARNRNGPMPAATALFTRRRRDGCARGALPVAFGWIAEVPPTSTRRGGAPQRSASRSLASAGVAGADLAALNEWIRAAAHDLAGIADAGLCHGAAVTGIANRFYQSTGDPGAAAAIKWFTELALRKPGEGVGGT
jgi:hypothetical protein